MPNNSDFWIVTDLDGTLMDENYDISPAKNTLSKLAKLCIPVIPCTTILLFESNQILMFFLQLQ